MRTAQIMPAALALAVLAAAPAAADIYIEQSNRHSGDSSREGEENGITMMWISEQAIRIEEPGRQMVHITDLVNSRLITIDREERQYYVIPLSQVRSDFQRAAAMMRQRMEVSWRVERSAEEAAISGYSCRLLRFHGRGSMTRGDSFVALQITIDYWMSPEAELDLDVFMRLMSAVGFEQNPFLDQSVLSELRAMEGYPIRTATSISIGSISDEIEQTVELIRVVEVEPGFYEVPADFEQVTTPLRR